MNCMKHKVFLIDYLYSIGVGRGASTHTHQSSFRRTNEGDLLLQHPHC